MTSYTVSHLELFNVMKIYPNDKQNEQQDAVVDLIIQKFELDNCDNVRNFISERLRKSFYNNFRAKMKKLSINRRSNEWFQEKYYNWVKNDFKFSLQEILVQQMEVHEGMFYSNLFYIRGHFTTIK